MILIMLFILCRYSPPTFLAIIDTCAKDGEPGVVRCLSSFIMILCGRNFSVW